MAAPGRLYGPAGAFAVYGRDRDSSGQRRFSSSLAAVGFDVLLYPSQRPSARRAFSPTTIFYFCFLLAREERMTMSLNNSERRITRLARR